MKWLTRLFGGSKDMAALPAGTKAPDFSLPVVSGHSDDNKDGGTFSLQAALKQGPGARCFFQGVVSDLPIYVSLSGASSPSARRSENHDCGHLAERPARHGRAF